MIPPLSEVKAAIKVFRSWEKTIAKRYPDAHKIAPAPTYATLAAAAGRLVELVESGQEVWWCEAHELTPIFQATADGCPLEDMDSPCRMVRKLLVDPPEEKP